MYAESKCNTLKIKVRYNLNSGGIYALRREDGRLLSEEIGKLHPA
jgi:hypothetical protein